MPFVAYFFRPLALPALLAAAALAGCGKTPGPVRLDFVAAPALTASDRRLGPADTVAVRLFAQSADPDQPLTRLRLTATATPLRRLFVYPAALANFQAQDLPAAAPQPLLDSALAPGTREFVFQTTLTSRTTTGTERFEFTATDAAGNTATRAFRLVVRRPDSLALVQSFVLLARPGFGPLARPLLALDSGQLLPRYAARLAAPILDAVVTEAPDGVRLRAFGGRATRFRATPLTNAGFVNADTLANFRTAYDVGTPAPGGTDAATAALAKGNVVAFRTAGGRYGLVEVTDLVRTPFTTVRLTVRQAK